jgi:hypothetical protein
MDAFDRWWQWAEKPGGSPLTIPAEIHDAVIMLTPRSVAIANWLCVKAGSAARGRSADRYGVPVAEK